MRLALRLTTAGSHTDASRELQVCGKPQLHDAPARRGLLAM
jgi:hypothetical protein